MSTRPSITVSDLSFAWPDGDVVFAHLSLTIGAGRSAIVGVNGSGKSTLLRLIAGRLTPASGSVTVEGRLGYLPQDVVVDADATVEDVLGITPIRAALRRIEAGDVSEDTFAAIGDDWDVEERAQATLAGLGLAGVDLQRPISTLSGGEAVLLQLGAQLLAEPAVLILDEPTNNLDGQARDRLYAVVQSWRRSLVVVSHDRELLRLVDQIGDLRDGEITWYGGNLDDYEAAVRVEQEAARRHVRAAEQDQRRQQRELAEAQVRLDRRLRFGRTKSETKREPKVIMQARKREAQVSAGKYRSMHRDKVRDAAEQVQEHAKGIRDDPEVTIDLPQTAVPAGKDVLRLVGVSTAGQDALDLTVRGPERIALVGRNGSGKTTLLSTISGHEPTGGRVEVGVPVRHLPQRLDLLDPSRSVAQNVHDLAPESTDNEVRARLARFLFRGRQADQPVSTLSGGELFRASLAALLLAEPSPQLLLLDEPTNNLDLASVRRLTEALAGYQGALIVASHDLPFLRDLEPTRWLELTEDGLHDIDPH